jgi:iron-sulfur cluster assembly accessory protein
MTVLADDNAVDAPVKVSDRAAQKIASLIAGERDRTALRISVEGGGCSGFQYRFDLVTDTEADDLVVRKGDAVVAIDPISLPYMTGSEIDLVDNLMGEGLEVHNPLATSSCGCGTSFAI